MSTRERKKTKAKLVKFEEHEVAAITAKADVYTGGNVSQWIREAAKAYVPATPELEAMIPESFRSAPDPQSTTPSDHRDGQTRLSCQSS